MMMLPFHPRREKKNFPAELFVAAECSIDHVVLHFETRSFSSN
jgi:hypothetical protein